MKSAFVGGGRLTSVYSEETIAALEREAGLASRAVLSREEVLAGGAADVDFVFSTWGMPRFSVDEIRRSLPRLRAVFYAAGSVQGFAREFLECGIPVFSAWAATAVPVVEYAVSQILLANKGFFQSCRRFRDRASRADAHRFFESFPGNYGCAVGILGAGMIGRAVLRKLAKEHRLRILVHDPFYDDAKAAEDGAERASLEEIFAICQTISNHIANLPATVGMLRYEHFRRMKPNATFINTGRGAQVVEADLVRALREEPGRTAVLDVTWPEPPEEGSPLYALPNVFLTPHIAGSSGDETYRMAEYMLEEFRNFIAGRPTRYGVTLAMLETMA